MKRAGRSARGFRSVLCPVDFSAHSRAAFRHAVEVARRTGGQVAVLYVDDPWLAAAAAAGYDSRLLTQQTMRELRQFVARCGVDVDGGDPAISLQCVMGPPAREILKAARRLDSNLIVMGTQGLSGARRMFFGSTTEQVLRRTAAPVLAVSDRAGKAPLPRRGSQFLGAVELGSDARRDARTMARVAREFDARLALVHVIKPVGVPPWLAPRLDVQDRTRLADARRRLRSLASIAGPRAECRVVLGDPAEELPAIAEDMGAAMLLLQLRRGRGIFGKTQGSTTYRVLTGSKTPVLALPPKR